MTDTPHVTYSTSEAARRWQVTRAGINRRATKGALAKLPDGSVTHATMLEHYGEPPAGAPAAQPPAPSTAGGRPGPSRAAAAEPAEPPAWVIQRLHDDGVAIAASLASLAQANENVSRLLSLVDHQSEELVELRQRLIAQARLSGPDITLDAAPVASLPRRARAALAVLVGYPIPQERP